MKKTETIFFGLAILGLIMTIFHLPYSGVLLVFSLLSISIFYFYFGFAFFSNIRLKNIFKKESYKDISTKRILGAIATGFALSVSAIGILFKFQSFPGTTVILGIGLFGLIVITIISSIKIQKGTDNYYLKILKRSMIFGVICIILLVLPTLELSK